MMEVNNNNRQGRELKRIKDLETSTMPDRTDNEINFLCQNFRTGILDLNLIIGFKTQVWS